MKGNEQPQRVVLCGVQGCCPVVEIASDSITVTDDAGGKVVLTRQQSRELGRVLAKSDSEAGRSGD